MPANRAARLSRHNTVGKNRKCNNRPRKRRTLGCTPNFPSISYCRTRSLYSNSFSPGWRLTSGTLISEVSATCTKSLSPNFARSTLPHSLLTVTVESESLLSTFGPTILGRHFPASCNRPLPLLRIVQGPQQFPAERFLILKIEIHRRVLADFRCRRDAAGQYRTAGGHG